MFMLSFRQSRASEGLAGDDRSKSSCSCSFLALNRRTAHWDSSSLYRSAPKLKWYLDSVLLLFVFYSKKQTHRKKMCLVIHLLLMCAWQHKCQSSPFGLVTLCEWKKTHQHCGIQRSQHGLFRSVFHMSMSELVLNQLVALVLKSWPWIFCTKIQLASSNHRD